MWARRKHGKVYIHIQYTATSLTRAHITEMKRKDSDLPIPDEPRKRNTSGCSSSYQPFCFLLMATEKRWRKKEDGGCYFPHLHLLTLLGFDSWPEASWYTRNDDKGPSVGIRKGLERFGGEMKKERDKRTTARWETSWKRPTVCSFSLTQWGH